jgi:choline-sulfatase
MPQSINSSRRHFLKALGLAGLAFATSCTKIKTTRPNIIFVLTDDQAPWALGVSGDPNAYTPNLDRLAAGGTRLLNCCAVTPVCSPSRASILTSRYGTELGITDYLSPARQPDLGLDTDLPTWPKALAKAGYATALVGKWHLGIQDKFHPTKFGYQEFTGFRTGAETSQNPTIETNGELQQKSGYTPDLLTNYALDFIKRNQQQPFLLSLHFWAPHANTANYTPDGDRTWLPLSKTDWERFENSSPKLPHPDYPDLDVTRTKRMMREYLASVASADRNIGRLLDLLDELHLAENTVVIFTSDHGFNMGHNGIWHKGNGRWLLKHDQGARPNLYENSLKVPAIVRWPAKIKASTTINQTITHLDWFPTITAMAETLLPNNSKIRGRNLLPLLQGKIPDLDNDMFSQYKMWDWNQTGANLRSYKNGHWKLVKDFQHQNKDELYNLKTDPDERINLIKSNDPAVVRQKKMLKGKLLEKMKEIGDKANDR